MDENKAAVLMDLLDVATEGNWPQVVEKITGERGYSPEEVVEAWSALEKLSGRSGSIPDVSDFS